MVIFEILYLKIRMIVVGYAVYSCNQNIDLSLSSIVIIPIVELMAYKPI